MKQFLAAIVLLVASSQGSANAQPQIPFDRQVQATWVGSRLQNFSQSTLQFNLWVSYGSYSYPTPKRQYANSGVVVGGKVYLAVAAPPAVWRAVVQVPRQDVRGADGKIYTIEHPLTVVEYDTYTLVGLVTLANWKITPKTEQQPVPPAIPWVD